MHESLYKRDNKKEKKENNGTKRKCKITILLCILSYSFLKNSSQYILVNIYISGFSFLVFPSAIDYFFFKT